MKLIGAFERLIAGWKSQGFALGPLGDRVRADRRGDAAGAPLALGIDRGAQRRADGQRDRVDAPAAKKNPAA